MYYSKCYDTKQKHTKLSRKMYVYKLIKYILLILLDLLKVDIAKCSLCHEDIASFMKFNETR